MPPSSYQSSLVERPRPSGDNGNLLITGNIAGGKYFHGNVPYRATTRIDALLGSTALDSFMRYTAPIEVDGLSSGYRPFYSPTGTVATLQPVRGSVFAPVAPGAGLSTHSYGGTTADIPFPTASGSTGEPAGTDMPLYLGTGPLSFSAGARFRDGAVPLGSDEASDAAAAPTDRRQKAATDGDAPVPGSEEYDQQLHELQQRLGQVQADADDLQRSLTGEDRRQKTEDVGRASSLASRAGTHDPLASDAQSSVDGALARRQQLLQESARLLSARMELPVNPDAPRQAGEIPLDTGETVPGASRFPLHAPPLRLYDPRRDAQLTLEAALSAAKTPAGPRAASERANDRSSLQIAGATSSDRVAALMTQLRAAGGSDKAIEPAERKTEDGGRASLRQAQGELSLAPDVHRDAQLHNVPSSEAHDPNEAQARLGRCRELFGAGQFLDSALSLARAIELDPNHALQQTDWVWAAGGPEAFIARFHDLARRAESGDVPQLQFLLAYIYYQMERPEEAGVAIDAARQRLPAWPAVAPLEAAIGR